MENEQDRIRLLVKLMLPIARICIRFGLPIQSAYEALKIAFTEHAAQSLGKMDSKTTLSRISIMTGLNRPTVKRIFRENLFSAPEMPIAAKIVGQWLHDPSFKNSRGEARALSIGTDDSDFAKLVRKVTKNYSPGTILQELLLQKIVEKKGEKIFLISENSVYRFSQDRMLNLYARNVETLSQTFEENVNCSTDDRNVHLRTEYDNVYLSKLPQIRAWLLQAASEFHKKARDYITQFDADISPKKGEEAGGRVVLGSFSFTTRDKSKE